MRVKEFITETPVTDITYSGNFEKNSSFGTVDRKLITSPKFVAKFKKKLLNTPTPINVIFVNSPEGRIHKEIGEVSKDWIQRNMPKFYEDMVKQEKITAAKTLDPDALNIIYTNNTGDERMPFTTWTACHRLFHSLARNNNYFFNEFVADIQRYMGHILELYGLDTTAVQKLQSPTYNAFADPKNAAMLNGFYSQIGTMKSARDNNIRTYFEFYYELGAQFLLMGKIKFNDAPRTFSYWVGRGDKRWMTCQHAGDLDYVNSLVDSMAENADSNLETLLGASVGKIFVM